MLICQDLAAIFSGCYTHRADAHEAHRRQEREPPTHMRTSDVFWKLFSTTGSISAYLMYRQLHPTTAN